MSSSRRQTVKFFTGLLFCIRFANRAAVIRGAVALSFREPGRCERGTAKQNKLRYKLAVSREALKMFTLCSQTYVAEREHALVRKLQLCSGNPGYFFPKHFFKFVQCVWRFLLYFLSFELPYKYSTQGVRRAERAGQKPSLILRHVTYCDHGVVGCSSLLNAVDRNRKSLFLC
jgi:hypothetical protein